MSKNPAGSKVPDKEVSFPPELDNQTQTPHHSPDGSKRNSLQSNVTFEDEHVQFFYELYPELRKGLKTGIFSGSSTTQCGTPRRFPSEEEEEGDIFLQREMGVYSTINFLIIVSLGTGIYLAPSAVLKLTGSTTESLMVWLFSGLLSLITAITYGELVSVVSQAGERFGYLLTAFSPYHAFFGPLPAFMSIWIEGLFLGPAQVSVMTLMMAEHLYLPVQSYLKTYQHLGVTDPIAVKQVIGVAAIGLITCINCRSLKTCIRVQLICGALVIMICTLVIGGGVYSLSLGHREGLESIFKDVNGDTTGELKAFHVAMWAYEGWNLVICISEEVKNPTRTIPLVVLIGLPLVIVIYLAMNLAFLSVLTLKEIEQAKSSCIFMFEEKLFGSVNIITPILFAISALSCAMCIQMGISRTCFAAGREGHTFALHTYLNVRRFTPTPAIISQAVLSLLYVIIVPFADLIEYSTFMIWTLYGVAFLALIVLRIQRPFSHRLYKVPLFVPIFLITLSTLVTLDPIFEEQKVSVISAAIFILIGVIVYHQLVYKSKRISAMDKINKFVRAALNVAPPTALPEGYAASLMRTMTLARKLQTRDRYYKTVM